MIQPTPQRVEEACRKVFAKWSERGLIPGYEEHRHGPHWRENQPL
jgi:hypothetical protein